MVDATLDSERGPRRDKKERPKRPDRAERPDRPERPERTVRPGLETPLAVAGVSEAVAAVPVPKSPIYATPVIPVVEDEIPVSTEPADARLRIRVPPVPPA